MSYQLKRKPFDWFYFFAFLILAVLIAMAVAQPYFESKAYNKLTGAHTTYWDAAWLELRVQDQPAKE